MFKWRILLCILTAFINLCLTFHTACAADDPDIPWMEMESEHFIIHYPASRDVFARRALSIAEEAHETLVPLLEWTPRIKTHLTITDNLDVANGWARVTPENEIRLYAYPPEISSELGDYDDWMRQLIYHEYTHILHLDNSSTFHHVIDAIIGPFAKVNLTAPTWYTEGLAVYYETLTSDSGRLRNAIYNTIVRNAALEGVIPTIDKMSAGLVSWPGGSGYYIYGSHLIQYLAETYGREKLSLWNKNYGKSLAPYAINRAAIKTWHKSWDELYSEWLNYEKNKAFAELSDAITENALTQHHSLVKPHRHRRPQYRPLHNEISYVKNNGYNVKTITLRHLDTGSEQDLVKCWGDCEHHWSDDGKWLYFRHSTVQNGYRQTEVLYKYQVENDETTRLELPERVRSFSIDHDTLYWIVQSYEQSFIYRQKQDQEYELIYKSRPFEQIEDIHVKNDQILVSVFDIQKRQFDIELMQFSPATETTGAQVIREKITNDKSPDMSPFFCNDDKICYLSTRNGNLNLWVYDNHTKQSARLTHLIDGMLDPTQSPNGDIYYTQYTTSGTTISVIHQKDIGLYPSQPDSRQETREYPELKDVSIHEPQHHLAWEWLFPNRWLPRFASDNALGYQFGISLANDDKIDHNSYLINLDYLPSKKNVNFELSYRWTGYLWTIGLDFNISQNVTSYYNTQKLVSLDYQSLTAEISAARTWNLRMDSHTFQLIYQFEYSETEDPYSWSHRDPVPNPVRLPSLGWGNSVIFNYTWSNRQQAEKAIVPNSGYTIITGLDLEIPWLGADYYAVTGYFMWWGAWTMPWLNTHVLSANVITAASWSENENRMPFSVSSNQGFVFNTSGQDSKLHGYPSGIVYGKYYLYGNLDYSCIIWEPSITYKTFPIGLDRIGATVFFDWANAWSDDFHFKDSKFDLGGKLHLDLILGYTLAVRVSLGYAWAGAEHGGHEVFFYWTML